jgi:hypothetical protein
MKWIAERRVLRAQTLQLLTALGDDADEVATTLESEGVRGKAHSSQGCAIAVYMTAIVGADHRVGSVIVTSTRLGIRPDSRWSPLIVVRLPRAVRQFISAFDAERFPHLLPAAPAPPTGPLTGAGQPASGIPALPVPAPGSQ